MKNSPKSPKTRFVTCKRCHVSVPETHATHTVYRGARHVICYACLAELERIGVSIETGS